MQVEGKVFVVTGAASGMGKEITLQLLKKGAKVAAVDLKEEALTELVAAVGNPHENLSTYAVNVSDKKAVEALPAAVIKDFGGVDAIINNAGIIQPFVKVNDLDYDAIERVMNVNFYGVLYMTKAFLPYLLKRPAAYVANTSSMGGFLPVPGQGVYGASKAAVKLMTEALYAELKDTSVGVSIIFPGAINTHITENSGVKAPSMPKGAKEYKTLSADKAAAIIIAGIEKNQPQIFVGSDSKMMNLLYRLNPVGATNLIAKQMKDLLGK